MELKDYKFPEVTEADMAFSRLDTDKNLLAEAESRNLIKGRDKFNELFFSGGSVEFQEDVRGTWKEKAYLYAKSLMGSFTPKHEHKETVCAMIFEECLVL